MSIRTEHHAPTAARCCRRVFPFDEPRPSELLAAFFRAGLLFMLAAPAAVVTVAVGGLLAIRVLVLALRAVGPTTS
jgi:hypothetical protein